ncbi:hypothetical protein [Oceanirhabdus seepicola]|uniref:Glutaredoxin domain-containing protein n=1 Tax=Oceanirhabdus seepicola TaxID=2828781 RepID=A0A9J6NYF3_9CLOT|nr:hypothetical protein [Oceanirhabdus seepicola]MCM1988669.1 hypothetical protein [Oceanirhabdus seepicola]
MKEFLSQNNVKFVYLDITDSMLNLKKFLKYRDARSEFEEIRQSNRVGLPCVMINKGEEFLFEQSQFEDLINK